MTENFRRWEKEGASLIIFGVSLFGYYYSLLPDVGQGDTAKFQFVGHVLGTPHATGYPLYIFLNYLFTHLFPFGSLAFKANLLSAIYAALSLVLTYQVLSILRFNRFISIMSCLVFGFTYTLWSQSIIAEVYTLNLLFVVLVTKYLILWHHSLSNEHLFWALGFYAFSFGNHMSMITMLPAILFLTIQTDKTIFLNYKKICIISSLIFLGVLQYSYLFLVYYSPRKTYLEMQTPDLKTFFWFVTGAQFKNRLFGFTFNQFIYEQIPMFFKLLRNEFSFLFPLSLLGLWHMRKNNILVFLLLIFLGNAIYSLNFAVGDEFVFFIPSYFIILLFISAGLSTGLNYFKKWNSIKIIFYLLLLCLPVGFLVSNYPKVSLRNHFQEKNVAESVLNTVRNNSLIISPNYEASETFWYYLIGLEMEAKRNIFLLHHWNPEAIKNYLNKQTSIVLPEERIQVPLGLSVYCLDLHQAENLRQKGLKVFKLNDHLFQIG